LDAANRTLFAIDQPSTELASFASPPISQVGIELDRKLGALLEALDVPAGGGLEHPRVASVPGPDGDTSSRPGTHDRADRPSQ
jgi:hypothetical protein